MRLALLALFLSASTARAASPPALATAAEALAREVGAPAEGRRALLLAVEARAPALRAPLETALDAALAAQGYAVTPHRAGGDPEAGARAGGQDWLLRVRAGLVPGRRELALVGELIPAWASFFLQRRPDARAVPPRIVQARAAADPETLLLAREAPPAGAPRARRAPDRSPPPRSGRTSGSSCSGTTCSPCPGRPRSRPAARRRPAPGSPSPISTATGPSSWSCPRPIPRRRSGSGSSPRWPRRRSSSNRSRSRARSSPAPRATSPETGSTTRSWARS